MSMPNFPEDVRDINCEQALNMLLGSIAMEELALSHIMNAEGEKLQYVLGTLPRKPCGCATTKEILEVNRSVGDLLEKVAYNQILLKGKLREVLEAKALCHPPEPPFPPDPPAHLCPPKAQCPCVLIAQRGTIWTSARPLLWKMCGGCESIICWQGCSSGVIHLRPQCTYLVSFSIRVRTVRPGAVCMAIQGTDGSTCEEILRSESCTSARELTAYLSGCTVLASGGAKTLPQNIQFCLKTPDSVILEQATLHLVAM